MGMKLRMGKMQRTKMATTEAREKGMVMYMDEIKSSAYPCITKPDNGVTSTVKLCLCPRCHAEHTYNVEHTYNAEHTNHAEHTSNAVDASNNNHHLTCRCEWEISMCRTAERALVLLSIAAATRKRCVI